MCVSPAEHNVGNAPAGEGMGSVDLQHSGIHSALD